MKKVLSIVFGFALLMLLSVNARSQTMKVGVFDIDLMVQAMPGYQLVDSLMGIYNQDSLGALQEYYVTEYKRLDSTYKADSLSGATGKKPKNIVDMVAAERQKAMVNVIYWQQIAQNKSDAKRSELSKNLYNAVVDAYKKVLARKKYTLVLKPQTYEGGFKIDNIFIAVARELKLTQLPQNLLFLGDDPDPVKQQPQVQKPPVTKPKN
jgi:Skp family chaperone for outer membrane proteins